MEGKECIYHLTVRDAREIAENHECDPQWDLWSDSTAMLNGLLDLMEANGEQSACTGGIVCD